MLIENRTEPLKARMESRDCRTTYWVLEGILKRLQHEYWVLEGIVKFLQHDKKKNNEITNSLPPMNGIDDIVIASVRIS